ncbi:MAG: cytochrome-c peroxidase [Gammaproteobacteria bacterium]|nr:MAG: cytochrome-c peroxidase [Gammaproteobacteria bacterium]
MAGGTVAMAKGKGPDLPAPDYDFRAPSPEKVELGRVLMFDKILSGNQNISCGTCHHSMADTGDGLSLPVGEGGKGLGVTRNVGSGPDLIHERVPRNAPPVFNLGDNSFHTLFHDGRVSTVGGEGFPSGCKTPAGHDLPDTLENVLACQAMFPVTSATEMAGQAGENSVADAAAAGNLAGPGGVWELLAERLQSIPEYVDMFEAAFPQGPNKVKHASDITYAHAANAIAAFEGVAWRADNSPFDQYLRGDKGAMSENAKKGMELFYDGDSNGHACAECHSGLYQTDLDFHAVAMPQIGSGRGSNSPGQNEGKEDFGREQVTGNPVDTLKFRTPTLRNVALTAPYGHGGAYNTLRAVVEHHLDAVSALYDYNYNRQAVLPTHPTLDAENYAAMDDPAIVDYIAAHNELAPFNYSEEDVDRIIDFLHALTDPGTIDLRSNQDVVNGVPSGLPLDD